MTKQDSDLLDKQIDEILERIDLNFVEGIIGNDHDSYPYTINRLAKQALTENLAETKQAIKHLIVQARIDEVKKFRDDWGFGDKLEDWETYADNRIEELKR